MYLFFVTSSLKYKEYPTYITQTSFRPILPHSLNSTKRNNIIRQNISITAPTQFQLVELNKRNDVFCHHLSTTYVWESHTQHRRIFHAMKTETTVFPNITLYPQKKRKKKKKIQWTFNVKLRTNEIRVKEEKNPLIIFFPFLPQFLYMNSKAICTGLAWRPIHSFIKSMRPSDPRRGCRMDESEKRKMKKKSEDETPISSWTRQC